jgi:hypothetical protein
MLSVMRGADVHHADIVHLVNWVLAVRIEGRMKIALSRALDLARSSGDNISVNIDN